MTGVPSSNEFVNAISGVGATIHHQRIDAVGIEEIEQVDAPMPDRRCGNR